jgi:hypothetical protein
MIRSPAMHAMTNPARFGLTVVRVYFGLARPKSNQSVVCHGEAVTDAEGNILLFVGMTEDRKPILARHAVEFKAKANDLTLTRQRHGGE